MENEVQVHAEPARAAGEPFLPPEAESALRPWQQPIRASGGYIDIRANADLLSCSPQWIDYGCVRLQMEPGEFGRVSPNM